MDDLINAEQAQALVAEAESLAGEIARTKTKGIVEIIKRAAQQGKRSVSISPPDGLVIGHLTKLGYEVKITHDRMDGDFATIKW